MGGHAVHESGVQDKVYAFVIPGVGVEIPEGGGGAVPIADGKLHRRAGDGDILIFLEGGEPERGSYVRGCIGEFHFCQGLSGGDGGGSGIGKGDEALLLVHMDGTAPDEAAEAGVGQNLGIVGDGEKAISGGGVFCKG